MDHPRHLFLPSQGALEPCALDSQRVPDTTTIAQQAVRHSRSPWGRETFETQADSPGGGPGSPMGHEAPRSVAYLNFPHIHRLGAQNYRRGGSPDQALQDVLESFRHGIGLRHPVLPKDGEVTKPLPNCAPCGWRAGDRRPHCIPGTKHTGGCPGSGT